MNVFVMSLNRHFTMVRPSNEILWNFKGGVSPALPWREFDFVPTSLDDEFMFVDCLTMNTSNDGFLLSKYARGHLEPLLGSSVTFWPVHVLGRPYWWLNCMAQVQVLNLETTDADWSEVSGSWGSLRWITATRRLMFEVPKLKKAPHIFRVPEYPQGVIFAQDSFEERIRDMSLTGFELELIWSSREGGVFDSPGVSLSGLLDQKSLQERETERTKARDILRCRLN